MLKNQQKKPLDWSSNDLLSPEGVQFNLWQNFKTKCHPTANDDKNQGGNK